MAFRSLFSVRFTMQLRLQEAVEMGDRAGVRQMDSRMGTSPQASVKMSRLDPPTPQVPEPGNLEGWAAFNSNRFVGPKW